MISFVVSGVPKGKARARTVVQGGRVHSYTPAGTANYERKVAAACLSACKGRQMPSEAPLKFSARIYMPIPKSANKGLRERLASGRVFHTRKPDIDNVLKSLTDGCCGIAYRDDNQIAAVYAVKRYSDCPRVEVEIEVIE